MERAVESSSLFAASGAAPFARREPRPLRRLAPRGILAGVVTAGLAAAPVHAQVADTATRPVPPAAAAAPARGALILGPIGHLDASIAREIQRSGPQSSDVLRDVATGFRVVGVPGTVLATGALLAVGGAAHDASTERLGVHVAEALLLGEASAHLLKGLVGRARPDVSAVSATGFGRGFGDDAYRSFPSGHTVAAFAAAAVLNSELSRRGAGSGALVGSALFGGATLVGVSRIYDNRHWTSDVVAGAALGLLSGRVVVRLAH